MENIIDFCDLVPIFKLGDSIVLMIHENELYTVNPACVKVNLGFKNFEKIIGLDYYLKFGFYEPVDWKNKDVRNMYQDIMMRKFNIQLITRMLIEFTQILEDRKSFIQ